MTRLVDPQGRPLSSAQYASRGRPAKERPSVGETSVNWGGDALPFMTLPDGGRIVLDPSRLTLSDMRSMKTHYQINSSLTVLTFMMHQLDYKIEASNSKVQAGIEYAMDRVWTRLVRAMSTAFWAGYSPNALQWENDPTANMLVINKIKDLVPEFCEPAWQEVDAVNLNPQPNEATQPKSRVFDGITQRAGMSIYNSQKYHIPVSNSFWYPLLMENGDMYGTKLLKSAYAPWFFSNMMHAYANSYYERFGEPVPVARAPYGDTITVDGKDVDAARFMQSALSLLRSGAAVVLPNDRQSNMDSNKPDFEYTIEYLESQMRGADFEKHMSRLDEEMSLALFTPLLLMRTTDSGGYNQAVSQTQIYLWQLNAIAADWKEYIDKYIIAPLVKYNYGGKQWARIKFRKMGTTQQETVRAIVQELLRSGKIGVDVEELGFAAGLSLEEMEVIQEPGDGTGEPQDKRIGRPEKLKDDDLPSNDKQKTTTTGLSKQIDKIKDSLHGMVTRQEIAPTDTVADALVVAGADRAGAEKFATAVRILAVDAVMAKRADVVDSGVDHLCRKYL